jgi:hypothetical protein
VVAGHRVVITVSGKRMHVDLTLKAVGVEEEFSPLRDSLATHYDSYGALKVNRRFQVSGEGGLWLSCRGEAVGGFEAWDTLSPQSEKARHGCCTLLSC